MNQFSFGPRGALVLRDWLTSFSIEVTSKDAKGIEAALARLVGGSEIFVAHLPNESADKLVGACRRLAEGGLVPVPHIVARNVADAASLDRLLGRLVSEAGTRRLLVLGGDRDQAVGSLDASLDIIRSGAIEKHGIERVFFAGHPEGHPRVSDDVLRPALVEKLKASARIGVSTGIVTQFGFDPEPIVSYARWLRSAEIDAPLRVGVSGPADRAALIRFALMCGVGASLRALKERHDLAKFALAGETPLPIIERLAAEQARDPSLDIEGVHFFTLGSIAKSVEFAQAALSSVGPA